MPAMAASPEGVAAAWRRARPPSEAFWDRENWERFLVATRATPPVYGDVVPVFDVQLLVQPVSDPLEAGSHSVRIALENLREDNERMECGLFNVSIRIELPETALGHLRLERVKRSYDLAGFMTMPAIGVNGGVVDLGVSSGMRALRTTWMPRYVLPRTAATEIPSVPTSYATLASETTDVRDLFALTTRWMRGSRKSLPTRKSCSPGKKVRLLMKPSNGRRLKRYSASWRREKDRIRKGLDLLARSHRSWQAAPMTADAIPYRAWLLLNQTFARANPERAGARPGWRLFQLAFILAHIPTLASRLDEFRRNSTPRSMRSPRASSTWRPAAERRKPFSVLTLAALSDRLRGSSERVTAMMHYPAAAY